MDDLKYLLHQMDGAVGAPSSNKSYDLSKFSRVMHYWTRISAVKALEREFSEFFIRSMQWNERRFSDEKVPQLKAWPRLSHEQ